MAKEIIDMHGGAIWATNNSGASVFMGGKGARFLILLDPTNGEMRQKLPELFNPDKVPVGILEEIERLLGGRGLKAI